MTWPRGVIVGHTFGPGEKVVILDCPRRSLTPAEAREVARSLILRADYQDRTPDTYADFYDGIPRRKGEVL